MRADVKVNNDTLTRSYGIDALKVISMFMVVSLHIMGTGGLLEKNFDLNAQVLWFIKAFTISAVNIYAMTSGYLLFKNKFKVSRILKFWIQAVFYGLLFVLIYKIFRPEMVGVKQLIGAFLPVCFNNWWYFTAFFILSLLVPFINKMVESINCRQSVMLVILICISSFPCLFETDIMVLNKGYSTVWLIAMYIIGALIRKYNFENFFKKSHLVLVLVGTALCLWISRMIFGFLDNYVLHKNINAAMLYSYLSPLVIIIAAVSLMLFSKINFNVKTGRFLSKVSTLCFAVYLIHEYKLNRVTFIEGKFSALNQQNVFTMLAVFILTVLCIFTICIIIEWVRTLLFKVLRIDSVINKVGNAIDNKIKIE